MNTRFLCAVMIATVAVANAADAPLVKQYFRDQLGIINGYPQISVAGPDFRTGAMVDVSAAPTGKGAAITASDAERASNSSTAAVAVAVGKVVPAFQPAEMAPPSPASHIGFKDSWNSAQAWATMKGNGMPFLDLQTFGQSSAAGTATWNARVVMPQANGLYVSFTLPSVTLKGTLEQNGPSAYQGRFRAELLVNGHSVWTSEANRFNQLNGNYSDSCSGDTNKAVELLPFGVATGLTTDSQVSSTGRIISLGLGQMAAGQEIQITLVVRADSRVNKKCCIKTVDGGLQESFCTGAVATLGWTDDPDPVTFRMGPVL